MDLTPGDELIKVQRERDSLARRLGIRWGELEEARSALRQMTDERDRWQAEADSLTDQLGDMRATVSAAEADRDVAYRAGREDAAKEADHDRDVLARVGRMYLDALDNDPEHEYLTLPEALMVTEVRDAVDRWERRGQHPRTPGEDVTP